MDVQAAEIDEEVVAEEVVEVEVNEHGAETDAIIRENYNGNDEQQANDAIVAERSELDASAVIADAMNSDESVPADTVKRRQERKRHPIGEYFVDVRGFGGAIMFGTCKQQLVRCNFCLKDCSSHSRIMINHIMHVLSRSRKQHVFDFIFHCLCFWFFLHLKISSADDM